MAARLALFAGVEGRAAPARAGVSCGGPPGVGCEGVWGRRGLVMLVRVVQNLCGGGVCVDHGVREVRYRRFGEG